jgi:preprotein translocase subunit SecE
MIDLLYIVLVIAFFALTAGLIIGLDHLMGS